MPKWFALTVKPLHEKVVAQQLSAKSLESYVPLYRERRRWSDRIQTLEKPLFPRYVFCCFERAHRARVLATPSVQTIVGFGSSPVPIPDEDINQLKVMVGSGLPVAPWRKLALGQKVRVCHGPLIGLEGILSRHKSGERVVVNIELLQCGAAVDISADLVRPVGDSPRKESATTVFQTY